MPVVESDGNLAEVSDRASLLAHFICSSSKSAEIMPLRGEQPHVGTVTTGHHAIAVMLDFVNPRRAASTGDRRFS
jgi:hypothetical protein